jgi:inorganic triphosphatase YgiF
VSTEVELKLVTSKRGLSKALLLPWLRRMANGNIGKRQHLVSVYFDTRDFALHDRGVSLRVRRVGEQRLQTVKANSPTPMGRREWEVEIDRDQPKLELARHTALAPILNDEIAQHLKPVFETRIQRRAIPLQVGRSEIELALDEGRVITGDASIAIAEIEIELKHGERSDVGRLARKLAQAVPVTLGARAKAEWGYALAEDAVNAPMSTEAILLAPSSSVVDAIVIIGFSCLRQIAGNALAVRQRDPEGIHQMRVGLRRLRAALSFFKDVLRDGEGDHIKRQLRWLTEQLGPGRDADVFMSQSIVPCLKHHPDRVELDVLAHDFEKERDLGFAKAQAAVESKRFDRVLLDSALWLIDGEWRNDNDDLRRTLRERSASAFAEEELARRTRKIVKRVRKLERLDASRQHKLRIAVKKVRYAREFFASLNPDRRRRKARRKIDHALKGLQSALGDLNDMRVHMYWARDFARSNTDARKAFAIGYVIGREDASSRDVLAKALAAGKRLKNTA